MTEKRYLFTPGPTPVPPQVLAAMAQPIVHHRGPDFRIVYERCLARLKEVFRTESEVLLYTSSGTGTMESAVANLCSPGERVCVVSAGAFGERWAAIAEAYGCEVDRLAYEWGETPFADDLASRLAERESRVVLLTHSETSTGVVADVRALAAVAKEAGALSVVDAISSLGAVPLETDEWGVDVVISGSQKALMTPPGPRARLRLAGRVGRARDAAALLLRLGADAQGAGDLRRGVHAGRLARPRARRRARNAARARPRGGLRAPRAPRPCLPRGDQGDGARALLAGRRQRGRRHRRARAPRESTPGELLLLLRDRHGVTLAAARAR